MGAAMTDSVGLRVATIGLLVQFAHRADGQSCADLSTCERGGSCGGECTCPSGQTCQGAHGTNFCVSNSAPCSSDPNNLFGGRWFCQFCSCPIATPRCACERWNFEGTDYQGLVCVSANQPTTALPSTVSPSTISPSTVTPTTLAPSSPTPTTAAPTTVVPSTTIPTTAVPTTTVPSTGAPSSLLPTTLGTIENPSGVFSTYLQPGTSTSRRITMSSTARSSNESSIYPLGSSTPAPSFSLLPTTSTSVAVNDSGVRQTTGLNAWSTPSFPDALTKNAATTRTLLTQTTPSPNSQTVNRTRTGEDSSADNSNGEDATVIAGVVCAIIVLVLLLIGLITYRRRLEAKNLFKEPVGGKRPASHVRNSAYNANQSRIAKDFLCKQSISSESNNSPTQVYHARDAHFYQNQAAIDAYSSHL